MVGKKQKAKPRAKRPVLDIILGPQWPGDWISVRTAKPHYDRPVLVTDGVEFAHCERGHTDRHGEHYHLVDEGSEFTNVTHWCEEPLLPNGKPPRHPK